MKIPIPTDWDNETWELKLVCWPKSNQWQGIFNGILSIPVRGRFWDERTGTITDAQNIGREILKRSDTLCDQIITELQRIATAIEAIEIHQQDIEIHSESTATATALQVDASLQLAGAYSQAQAWSNSIANNFLNVELTQNMVVNMLPECAPSTPPPPGQDSETGITDTPTGYTNGVLCDVSVAIVDATIQLIEYLADYYPVFAAGVQNSGFYIVRSALTWLATVRGAGHLVVPINSLIEIVGAIADASTRYVQETFWTAAVDYVHAHRQDFICILYNGAKAGDSTYLMHQEIVELVTVTSPPGYTQIAQMVVALMNVNTLATLYFDSPVITSPYPSGESCEDDCGGPAG